MELKVPQHVMLKLRVWRDLGSTEVTGFFITEKGDMSTVIDAELVRATCTGATVNMTPEAMAEFYQEQIDKKIYPDQLMVWWHTHPGNSAMPSGTDEMTFRNLGKDRASNIMYILACGGQEFAQLSVTDKQTQFMIKKSIAITHPIVPWVQMPSYGVLEAEYNRCVEIHTYTPVLSSQRLTQREIYDQNYGNTELAPILEQLDSELSCMDSYPEFLVLVKDMLVSNEIADADLNRWFMDNNLPTRSKGVEIIHHG